MKKLNYVDGNLLTFPDVQVIGHCANCQNTFGSGIALSIKQMYPVAYEADTKASVEKTNVLGNISYAGLRKNDKPFVIFNLYGQDLYGRERRMVNYESIYCALEKMRKVCDLSPTPVNVGFPYLMASDRAGGDWRIIERFIEVLFDGFPGEVYIVKYNG